MALEIGVQLGIKGERERFGVFTRMNLFLEEMSLSLRQAKLDRFSHLRARYVLFICVCPFRNFHIRVSLPISHSIFFLSRLLHQAKWKFTVPLKLK